MRIRLRYVVVLLVLVLAAVLAAAALAAKSSGCLNQEAQLHGPAYAGWYQST